MNEYQKRIKSLVGLLPEDIDAAILTSEVNIFYFSGFRCDAATLVIDRQGGAFITDFRYVEAARDAVSVCETTMSTGGEYDTLKGICESHGIKTFAVERSGMTVAALAAMARALDPAAPDNTSRLDDIISSLRISKSDTEVVCVKAAQAITEDGFDHIISCIKEGVTEKELALELEFFMRGHGAERVSFDPIVASGENGSKPHAVPGERKIKLGDLITFDLGCVVGGYCSDMTRTVAFGHADDEARAVYDIVLAAQLAALEYLLAGGDDAAECDGKARALISGAGYGECFGHSLGHGVGLNVHESPSMSPRVKATLSPGTIVTVEPGIYIPGKMGVRIEDMVLKTEDSIVNLTHMTKELIMV